MAKQGWQTMFSDFAHAAAALFRQGRMPVGVNVWYADGFEWNTNLAFSSFSLGEWEGMLAKSLRPGLAHARHARRRPVVAAVWFSDHISLHFAFSSSGRPDEEGDVLSRCKQDIKNLLREANHRLVTHLILEGLEERGKVWGESTVKRTLAEMVLLGELTNRQDVRPRGYGLPEWG